MTGRRKELRMRNSVAPYGAVPIMWAECSHYPARILFERARSASGAARKEGGARGGRKTYAVGCPPSLQLRIISAAKPPTTTAANLCGAPCRAALIHTGVIPTAHLSPFLETPSSAKYPRQAHRKCLSTCRVHARTLLRSR